MKRHVVVVGAGVAGLAAAFEASGGPTHDPHVSVEVIESSPTLGGALQTTTFGGRSMDLGADGFLATRNEGQTLLRDLGAEHHLRPIAAQGAWIYLGGQLVKIPHGLVLGVPTRWSQTRSMPYLSRRAKYAAWRDLVAPRRLTIDGDTTIGHILRTKFNDALVNELIEPMIGGIQAGRVDELSARDVFPALLAAARKGGSLQRAIRPPVSTGSRGPLFFTLEAGMGSLPQLLAEELRSRGVTFRLGSPVTGLQRGMSRRWSVLTDTSASDADAVVMSAPVAATFQILRDVTEAVAPLASVRSAGAAMVTFCVPYGEVDLPADGTGVLVPLQTKFREGDDSLIVTAITLLDRKWTHLNNGETHLIRVHTGRIDDRRTQGLSDAELETRVRRELVQILGRFPSQGEAVVQRWPNALPQYEPGHSSMIEHMRRELAAEQLFMAGMLCDGVGVPASIGSGRAAGEAARLSL